MTRCKHEIEVNAGNYFDYTPIASTSASRASTSRLSVSYSPGILGAAPGRPCGRGADPSVLLPRPQVSRAARGTQARACFRCCVITRSGGDEDRLRSHQMLERQRGAKRATVMWGCSHRG